MKLRQLVLAASVVAAAASGALVSTAAFAADAKEQFFPVLPYRTGAYAPNGVPWANGYSDYLRLINSRFCTSPSGDTMMSSTRFSDKRKNSMCRNTEARLGAMTTPT